MWFQRKYKDAVYLDKRRRKAPDIVADFRKLPFRDGVFDLVLFDPPHTDPGKAIMAEKFGNVNHFSLGGLYHAFRELFRVLRNNCFLVLKWGTHTYSLRQVLQYSPIKPLFGQRTRQRKNMCETYWVLFQKQ